jgi:hypothetical protein
MTLRRKSFSGLILIPLELAKVKSLGPIEARTSEERATQVGIPTVFTVCKLPFTAPQSASPCGPKKRAHRPAPSPTSRSVALRDFPDSSAHNAPG